MVWLGFCAFLFVLSCAVWLVVHYGESPASKFPTRSKMKNYRKGA